MAAQILSLSSGLRLAIDFRKELGLQLHIQLSLEQFGRIFAIFRTIARTVLRKFQLGLAGCNWPISPARNVRPKRNVVWRRSM